VRVTWPKCSAAEFGAVLGVSAQAIGQWMDAGMPCKRGRGNGHAVEITPEEALPWAISRRAPAGSERERLASEQADKVALENAVKRGELIHVGQVADVLSEMAASLAGQLDALPGRVASELAGLNDPGVIRARLLDETRGIRAAVADAGEKLANSRRHADAGDEDPAPAAEKDGKRVGGRKPRATGRKRRARPVAKR
jgi:terminase small subunit / prophage DNA-packing protein